MAYLCKCTNCDTILIDENPQVDAIDFDISNVDYTYMVDFGCPNCQTDGYLVDITDESELKY